MNFFFLMAINALIAVNDIHCDIEGHAKELTTEESDETFTTDSSIDNIRMKNFNSTFETYLDHFNVTNNETIEFNFTIKNDIKSHKFDVVIFELVWREKDDLFKNLRFGMNNTQFVQLNLRYAAIFTKFSSEIDDDLHNLKNYSKYVQTEQVLEDVIKFIQWLKFEDDRITDSTVVVCGCDIMGTIAIWLRYKYPHIVDIAWGNSAIVELVSNYSVVKANVRSLVRDSNENSFRDYISHVEFGYDFAYADDGYPKDLFKLGSLSEFDPDFLAIRQRNIARRNRLYGVESLNVENIIALYGEDDPLHVLGFSPYKKDCACFHVVTSPGSGHCGHWKIEDGDLRYAFEGSRDSLKKWHNAIHLKRREEKFKKEEEGEIDI